MRVECFNKMLIHRHNVLLCVLPSSIGTSARKIVDIIFLEEPREFIVGLRNRNPWRNLTCFLGTTLRMPAWVVHVAPGWE
jgi:hypothetical protein